MPRYVNIVEAAIEPVRPTASRGRRARSMSSPQIRRMARTSIGRQTSRGRRAGTPGCLDATRAPPVGDQPTEDHQEGAGNAEDDRGDPAAGPALRGAGERNGRVRPGGREMSCGGEDAERAEDCPACPLERG